METEVLIVGAGPTGLVLALWLARLGVRVRLIDQTAEPGTTSRALVLQARTLEFYRQLGFAQEVVAAGLELRGVNLWAAGHRVAHVELGSAGSGSSPYSFGLVYPQDEHERFLIERLAALGVQVERQKRLEHFTQRADGVIAIINGERCEAQFLAGCDGARSTVREGLGVAFPGGTYQHLFYVADVDAGGPLIDQQLHVAIDKADFVALFPLAHDRRIRLIGTVAPKPDGEGELRWEDVRDDVLHRLQIDVEKVNWFSTYRVHHRVATHFQQGRAFLLGDAAHVHSPVGGQGMNTGIGDAVNLGWKLAAALRGTAPLRVLDTYQPERIGFARHLVATTDRLFELINREGAIASWVKLHLAGPVISRAMGMRSIQQLLFRTVSQNAIAYRDSELSDGQAGQVHAGDRLPWVPGEFPADNFAPLDTLDWQLHVYGTATPELERACSDRSLMLHVTPWSEGALVAGLARDAAYLIRPDGHVSLADPHQNVERLARHLDRLGLRFISRDQAASESWYSGL